ncbi:CshA/CshB family fibrillar adhesin-related protein [Demequina iriomotensis]|uniref:CshA/CshB family fibrillar adhesin-related protein n=1 Tax=Demequina iriomotensis TaxID=1536641 RepID=UPI000782E64C|nr:CshA/CshB family fibrillar adhesin-related protein [Demequina iriomotensis]
MNRATSLLRARAPRRRLPAVAILSTLVAATVVPGVLTAPPAGAVAATGGTARFPSVQWISWGASGSTLTAGPDGRIVTTESIAIGAQRIDVTCAIDEVAGDTIKAYASGTWRGDGLDDLYNIGGTGTSNGLVAGVGNVTSGSTVTFDFECDAALVDGAASSPLPLAGLVMASAESSVYSGSGTWERVGATISNAGTWRILDRVRGAACTNDNYLRRTETATTSTLMMYGSKSTACEASGGPTPNPMAVAFMDGVSAATDVTLQGRGNEAIALGVVIDVDFGDAPTGYGAAAALSQGRFTGGVPALYTGGDGQGVFTIALADQLAPVLRLGPTVDFEGVSQASADAGGDDAAGIGDEDGVTLDPAYHLTPGGTLTIPAVRCYASAAEPGLVAGWIDFDGDGVFQDSERSDQQACPDGGGTVDLVFEVPATAGPLATQTTFARFRIAPTAAELTPTGFSSAGEVEDYAMTLEWPPAPGMSLTKTHTGGAVVAGQTLTFDLAFTNTGNVPLTAVAVADPTATTSGCTWATVAPHATVTCTAAATVTASDVARGYVRNTATASATDPDAAPLAPVSAVATVHAAAKAVDDSDETPLDTALVREAAAGVLVNDIGGALTVTGHDAIAAAAGTLAIAADGAYTYTPASGFSGIVTADYSIEDGDGATDTATLTIVVRPTADDDADTVEAGATLTRGAGAGVLTDDRGSALRVVGADPVPAAAGVLVIDADGGYTFTPAAGFSGTTSAAYTVEDAAGQRATATLTLTVTPTAGPDSAATRSGDPVTLTEAQLTDDDRGSALAVVAATDGAHGMAVLGADGSITYTPEAGYSGADVFTYTVEDAEGRRATAHVTVAVTPAARDDVAGTAADTPLSRGGSDGLLANDAGAGLTVVAWDALAAGQGTLTVAADGSFAYTPPAGYSGTVVTTYTVEDASGQRASATLTIAVDVAAVDDADATVAGDPLSRAAVDGVLVNDLGSALTVVAHDAVAAAHGVLAIAADGSYTFAPADGFSGTVTAGYTIEDHEGRRASAILTIEVTPAAADDADATTAGLGLTRGADAGVLANDVGSALTVVAHDAPAAGVGTLSIGADGAYTFTPAAGFSGTTRIAYTVEDSSGGRASAVLAIVVTPVAADDAGSTRAGVPLTFAEADLTGNDQGTALRVVATTEAAHGTVTLGADGSVTYAPDGGFVGTDAFTYTVRDAEGAETTATVVVTVIAPVRSPSDDEDGSTPDVDGAGAPSAPSDPDVAGAGGGAGAEGAGASGELSETGADVASLLAWMAALLGFGGVAVLAARHRTLG